MKMRDHCERLYAARQERWQLVNDLSRQSVLAGRWGIRREDVERAISERSEVLRTARDGKPRAGVSAHLPWQWRLLEWMPIPRGSHRRWMARHVAAPRALKDLDAAMPISPEREPSSEPIEFFSDFIVGEPAERLGALDVTIQRLSDKITKRLSNPEIPPMPQWYQNFRIQLADRGGSYSDKFSEVVASILLLRAVTGWNDPEVAIPADRRDTRWRTDPWVREAVGSLEVQVAELDQMLKVSTNVLGGLQGPGL